MLRRPEGPGDANSIEIDSKEEDSRPFIKAALLNLADLFDKMPGYSEQAIGLRRAVTEDGCDFSIFQLTFTSIDKDGRALSGGAMLCHNPRGNHVLGCSHSMQSLNVRLLDKLLESRE